MFGNLSLDPNDYPEFSVGQGWGPIPDLEGFGADAGAPVPPAPPDPSTTPVAVQPSSTVEADDWVDPQTTYTIGPEARLRDVVPYLTGTPTPQFPEQEDLSIFGWVGYPEPRWGFGADAVPVKLTYAQQCMAARDACYAQAAGDHQATLACDGVYSKCFAADPAFNQLATDSQKAATATAFSALITLSVAGAVGAGVAYGGARLMQRKPETAKKWAVAGGVAAPAVLIYSIIKAIGSFT